MRIYLDTSAFVKRYCVEEGSDMVEEVFESGNEAFDVENREEREKLRRLLAGEDD